MFGAMFVVESGQMWNDGGLSSVANGMVRRCQCMGILGEAHNLYMSGGQDKKKSLKVPNLKSSHRKIESISVQSLLCNSVWGG